MTSSLRKYPRVYSTNNSPSMTKTSFKDEVNINNIMARFQRTGAIDHYMKHAPTYGDATPVQLIDAQNIIAKANEMFDDLPSSIRKRFNNDPAQFLDFVQDENNAEEMVKLGLKSDKIPDPTLVQQKDLTNKQSEPASASPKKAKNEETKDD